MKHFPVVHFSEYSRFTTKHIETGGYQLTERVHPEFGTWKQRSMDLGHMIVTEHQANLTREVGVLFDDGSLKEYVHHCQSLGGIMGTRFEDHKIQARLTPQTFHSLFIPGDMYQFSMTPSFTNIHIAIRRSHYVELLNESEKWSAEMREKILNNLIHYSGEMALTPHMAQIIQSIFNSPLSGSLKKLLIEAQLHELVALQLHAAIETDQKPQDLTKKADTFFIVRDYLDKTFLEEHSLKSISRQFGLNEFTLKKGFRETFNTTVFDYLLDKRLEHALELLRSSSQSIQQISSVVGYKYPNHFSAAFKKKFGVTPAQVR